MRGKILVVDDDRNVLDVFMQLLDMEGFEAFEAADGMQALEIARKQKPDLIVLDMMMPGMNGLDVLKILKKEFPPIPVIILSGVQEETKAREAIGLGAYDYMVKPVQWDDFSNNCLNRIFD